MYGRHQRHFGVWKSSMFGHCSPDLCAHCHQDELQDLAVPFGTGDQVWRRMDVQTSCDRCSDGTAPRGERLYTVKEIILPARLVADARALSAKCTGSTLWATKPANADLQLINLLATERDGARASALLTAGYAAIKDEEAFTHRRGLNCCGLTAVNHCLQYMRVLRRFPTRGTAWRKRRGDPAQKPSDGGSRKGDAGDHEGDGDSDEKGGGIHGAEVAERVEAQQRCYRDGETINSTVVEAPGDAPVSNQAVGEQVGERTAAARFPSMSAKEVFVFGNDPRNLEAANTLRNVDVGNHRPSESEAKTRDALIEWLKTDLFTERECQKAMTEYTKLTKVLPKKLPEGTREKWCEAALQEASGTGLGFSKFVEAFVKAEVTAKPKPRPIANHKEIRLCALAKVAYVYEHVIFHRLEKMSIKHRPKGVAIDEIATQLSSMRNGKWVENDLTSFEFGICEQLKACECSILRHIAKMIRIEDTGEQLFERVMDDRIKSCVWTMRYKDEAGERRNFRLIMPRAMRESGDRITSSGNFLQNLIAWVSFLVAPETVKQACSTLLRTRGERMFYTSARDGKKYLAMLCFEGDDTLGRLEESVWQPYRDGETRSHADDFFLRWGWKPKLSWKNEQGYDYARFVGWDVLIKDNKAMRDGTTLVATPEIKRLLTTKQWTTSKVSPAERKTCNRIFAATLAHSFTRLEPIHAFLRSMYDANQGGKTVKDAVVREHYLMMTGELPTHDSKEMCKIEFPDFDGSGSEEWKELARVSAGDFTDLEWATACAQAPMRAHGADMATGFPASWL